MFTVFDVTVGAWLALVAIVLLLALYRLIITRGSWTVIHVHQSELSLVPQQVVQEHRLDRIDLWLQILTASAVLVGLVLAVAYVCIALGELLRVPSPLF